MKSYELVAATIKGNNNTRLTPLYGWVKANLKDEISEAFGCVKNFEDHYNFDMAHIFGGPRPYNHKIIEELKQRGEEITPEVLLDIPLNPVDNIDDYKSIIEDLKFYREERERFCYVQTPGIFEGLNDPFGIENHLCYLALYPEELKEVYKRQADWISQYASNMIELGLDMIHVSDDWGSQKSLMFSLDMWKEMIYPYHRIISDSVKKRDVFLSLHSDGCIAPAVEGIVELGYDLVHPWQESAGMSYDLYLEKYSDKLAILGGLCVQSTLGFGNIENVKKEIERVFSILKGKRWVFCTTHFVQNHCSMEELILSYDLAAKLARP